MTHVVIPYRPRWYQWDIHRELRRFNVLLMHRRAGKTVLAINELVRRIITTNRPLAQGAYVAPYYRQAKRVAWAYLKEFTRPIPGMQYLQGELRAVFPNGDLIDLYGADNPDSHRGVYLDAAVLDEVPQMSPRMWTEVIRPTLADRQGSAIFIATPMGRMNQFHDLWRYANESNDPEWYGKRLTVTETDAIPDAEVAALRREMDDGAFAQEMMCSFDANVKGAFYADEMDKAEREGRIHDSILYDPGLPLFTSWDLGLRDATVCVFWQVGHDAVRIIDCGAWTNRGLGECIQNIRETRPHYRYQAHYGPHDLRVREQQMYGAPVTRLEMAAAQGWDFEPIVSWSLMDGIEAVRALLPRVIWARDKCRDLIEAMRLYRAEYKDRERTYKTTPLHDWTSDYTDAVRSFAVSSGTQRVQLELGPSRADEAHWRAERERIAI